MTRRQTPLVDAMTAGVITDPTQLRELLQQKSQEFLKNPPKPNRMIRYKGGRIAGWFLTMTHFDGLEGGGSDILLDEYGNFHKGLFRRSARGFSVKQLRRMIDKLDEGLKAQSRSIPHHS